MRPRFTTIMMFLVVTGSAWAVEPLVPEPIPNDERRLSLAIHLAEPVDRTPQIQQVDITVARVATWDGERDLRARLWLPAHCADQPRPLIVYVHGGGFIGGSHEMDICSDRGFAPALRALLDAGYAVASADYRLAREAGWPAPIQDTTCVIACLTHHAECWNLDPDRVGLIGHSAGARIVGLLGTIDLWGGFHRGLRHPWLRQRVVPRACYLWAGCAYEPPSTRNWAAFAKPRAFSVPRLLFGEHPLHDQAALLRWRWRHTAMHLGPHLPPLFQLRGEDDYGGDHADAERAVAIWQALGAPARLQIVPGGHNAVGPDADRIAFFDAHVRDLPDHHLEGQTPAVNSYATEFLRLGLAAEVFDTWTHTNVEQPGQWLLLQSRDGYPLYLRDADQPHPDQAVMPTLWAARQQLVADEASVAVQALERGEWSRAAVAARNAHVLLGSLANDESAVVAESLSRRHEQLRSVHEQLVTINEAVRAGRIEAARAMARSLRAQDHRWHGSWRADPDRFSVTEHPDSPSWAIRSGYDAHGQWAELPITEDRVIRLRLVGAGRWDLPDAWRWRNTHDEPWITEIALDHPFWMSETEITVAEWRALGGIDDLGDVNRDGPIRHIDYLQIVAWLDGLTANLENVVARLPTEAEWLHAATGEGRIDVRGAANHHGLTIEGRPDSNADLPGVREVLPDLGGFYGMLGGVMEWTGSPGRHTARFTDDEGQFHAWAYPIARGGSWANLAADLSPADRSLQRHGNRQATLGFRLVISDNPATANWLEAIER